jgi:hypothetical protein
MEDRQAQFFTWLDPSDCSPPHGLDLEPNSRDSIKVDELEKAFKEKGFDLDMPALVGYPLDGKIQLLSGTHRHEAAKRANIKLPVHIILSSTVQATWGTELWDDVIKDIPVNELVCMDVPKDRFVAGIDERIDPFDFPIHE